MYDEGCDGVGVWKTCSLPAVQWKSTQAQSCSYEKLRDTSCYTCPTYGLALSESPTTKCQFCPAGRVGPTGMRGIGDGEEFLCVPCEAGRFRAETQQTETCTSCAVGLFSNSEASECAPCGGGYVPENWKEGTGASSSCVRCDPGSGANANSTSCEPCEGNNRTFVGLCLPCPKELVVDSGHSTCQACGVSQTAVPGVVDSTRICGCQNTFYNSSAHHFVCYANAWEYDMQHKTLVDLEAESAATQQECVKCPADVLDAGCLTCEDGQYPTVKAGWITPVLDPFKESTRRALLGNESSNFTYQSIDNRQIVQVFRCHIDLDIAALRCPANPDFPGQCNEGYKGKLCSTCVENYGMSPSRACEPCDNSGYTMKSMMVLMAMILSIAVICYIVSRFWKAFTLKHFARCAFQPGRIVITYSQVTSQLGDVLDFTYPPLFGSVIDALRPIMDLWGLLFRALGPSECFGIQGFASKWLLRVIGLPLIWTSITACYWCWDKRKNGREVAKVNAKAMGFFGVFFCYPTICIVSFASFLCKQLDETHHVLDADDSIYCEDAHHRRLQGASMVIIALVAIGMPLLFGFILMRSAHVYNKHTRGENASMAKRLAKEMQVEDEVAEYVVRDVTIGRDFSFLMDAFIPRYLYWEALDMFRKLSLVGLVLVVGRGTIAQLSIATLLSFSFFALQVRTQPPSPEWFVTKLTSCLIISDEDVAVQARARQSVPGRYRNARLYRHYYRSRAEE